VYICICHGITDHQIRSCVDEGGARTLCDLRGQLGVATQCGSCESSAMQILDETLHARRSDSAPSPLAAVDRTASPLAAAA
jgi:bacterioferritin-associated ferredoxin